MACECIECPECGGTGNVWVSFSGKYLGNRRCDDLDEMESCPQCGGSGIDYMCEECAYAQEEEERRMMEEEEAEKRERY